MSDPLNRATADDDGCKYVADDAFRLGCHVVPYEGIDYIVHDATSLDVTVVSVGDASAISMLALRKGTFLGGMGLLATMTTENARAIAAELVDAAEKLEIAANEAAHAALRKAAGK